MTDDHLHVENIPRRKPEPVLMLAHNIPLRTATGRRYACRARLELPMDLTQNDVARITAFLRRLITDWPDDAL